MASAVNAAHPDIGMRKKTLGSYVWGFALCVLLTLIPFYAVIHPIWDKKVILMVLVISAILQFFVQIMCFLRMHCGTEQGRINVMTLVFTAVVLFVIVGGSLWIMFNLNYFMM